MQSIQCGQNRPLTDARITLSVIGEPRDSFELNTRAGAFLLKSGGRAESYSDFLNEDNTRSGDGAIVFDGPKRELQIDLSAVAAGIEKIAIILAMRSGLSLGTTFGTFAVIRTVLATAISEPILEFPLPLASRNETALILAEVYRYKNQWKFRAVGQGFSGGLTALMSHFGLQLKAPPVTERDRPPPGFSGYRRPQEVMFSGTGFCVSPDGYFITNHHVIENAVEIRGRSPREQYRLRHVFSDPLNDLALLKASEPTSQVAVFRDGRQVRPGEHVIVIGYPLNGLLGSSSQVTTGNVSSLIGLRDDTRALQFTAPVQSGNSGGPLLDADGTVVGVVSAKLDAARIHALTGDVPQNVNFAIKSAAVRSFLEAVGVDYASRLAGSIRTTSEIAVEAQGFVVRIECYG